MFCLKTGNCFLEVFKCCEPEVSRLFGGKALLQVRHGLFEDARERSLVILRHVGGRCDEVALNIDCERISSLFNNSVLLAQMNWSLTAYIQAPPGTVPCE